MNNATCNQNTNASQTRTRNVWSDIKWLAICNVACLLLACFHESERKRLTVSRASLHQTQIFPSTPPTHLDAIATINHRLFTSDHNVASITTTRRETEVRWLDCISSNFPGSLCCSDSYSEHMGPLEYHHKYTTIARTLSNGQTCQWFLPRVLRSHIPSRPFSRYPIRSATNQRS
jgi:serine/threonine protein kinase